MTRLRILAWRILAIFKKKKIENEFDEEVLSHLDMLVEDNIRSGMTEEEARLAARRAFGGVERVKDLHRDKRAFVALECAWKDVVYGMAGLRKNPGFTVFGVLALALGVGANTTIFNAYNASALKPIPVFDPGNVVRFTRNFERHTLGNRRLLFSYDEYLHVRDHTDGVFTDLVALSTAYEHVILPSQAANTVQAKRIPVQLVSANFFDGLGIIPEMGRRFLPEEDRVPGANPIVILSHEFWKHAFGGDPQILGQTVKINKTSFKIVGVTPPEFTGTGATEQIPNLWVPLSMYSQVSPDEKWGPNRQEFEVLARLSRNVTLPRAQAQTDVLIRQYDSGLITTDETDKTTGVFLQHAVWYSATDDNKFQAFAVGLMLIVGLILLTACANLANMILARSAARQREIAVRMALGASRGRVVRQLLTESFLLSTLGGVAGLLLAIWSSHPLQVKLQESLIASGVTGLQINLEPDMRVFVYALATTVVVAFLCGLSPALQFSKPDLSAAFKEEGTSLSHRLKRSRLSSGLVAIQVAVSMFLLISAGLLVRGLLKSQVADPGFETRHVFVLGADYGDRRLADAVSARQRRLAEGIRSLPEIRGVAIGSVPSGASPLAIRISGPSTTVSPRRSSPSPRTLVSYASDSYLDLLGISLLRGRNFIGQEVAAGAHVAVVSEAGARLFWPDMDALGRHFQIDMDRRGNWADFEVVGITKDVRFENPSRLDPSHFYLPVSLASATRGDLFAKTDIILAAPGDLRALPAIQHAVAAIDREIGPSIELISLEKFSSEFGLQEELLSLFSGILSFLAVTLAGIGIYGVMTYLVTRRTREIGVRVALGASPRNVLAFVILDGLLPVFAGMLVGLAAAAALSAILHETLVFPGSVDLLYGVPFYDPATFLGVSCFVLGLALLASLVPLLGALRVDPMIALRCQ